MLVPSKTFAKPFKRTPYIIKKILKNYVLYCLISTFFFFFIKITLWEICQHYCVEILQFQFKADHNVAELKLHKRTVSIINRYS